VLHRAVEEWRPRIVRPATRIPVGFPVAEEHLRGLAVAKPHPGDPAYHQPREPPHRYQSARPLVEEVQRREKPRGRRGKPSDRHGAGQLAGAQSGQRQGAGEHPEADAVVGPPKTKPLWANLAAPSPSLPHRPPRARVCSPEVASDAAARAPPTSAAFLSPSDPLPDRPASLATEAVNLASEALETNWPVALSLAERTFSVKYRRTSAGSEPGRG
jgi:hypothetical protein